jgi:hypothetical protein
MDTYAGRIAVRRDSNKLLVSHGIEGRGLGFDRGVAFAQKAHLASRGLFLV